MEIIDFLLVDSYNTKTAKNNHLSLDSMKNVYLSSDQNFSWLILFEIFSTDSLQNHGEQYYN